jgi:transposase InsO family protein
VWLSSNDSRLALSLTGNIDEHTTEYLKVVVARRLSSQDVLEALWELFLSRGLPEHIRSENGPEFAARALREWEDRVGVKTLCIEPGNPWENGYVESFNGKVRYLNMGENWRQALVLVVFTTDLPSFKEIGKSAASYYAGRRVRAQGIIQDYLGRLEIVVKDPQQIEMIR